MIRRVKVKSLADCFDYVTDGFETDKLAIISIQKSADGGHGFRFTENSRCVGVLTLLFDDIEAPAPGLTAFSEEQARQVIEFIRAHRRDAETLLIHCYAGQSRSRAVGAFAVKMLGGNNQAYFANYVPNKLVYDTLLHIWETEYSGSNHEKDS